MKETQRIGTPELQIKSSQPTLVNTMGDKYRLSGNRFSALSDAEFTAKAWALCANKLALPRGWAIPLAAHRFAIVSMPPPRY